MSSNQAYEPLNLDELEAGIRFSSDWQAVTRIPPAPGAFTTLSRDRLLELIAELRAARKVADAAFVMLNEIDAGHGCDRLIQMPLRAALSWYGQS